MDREPGDKWSAPTSDQAGANQEGVATGRPDGKIEDGHPVISTNRARSGITLHAMRYVLGVSIGLVVIVFVVAYLITVVYRH
jgi:hypothetical protein